MKTKYDWSNVPKEVKWIATGSDGVSCTANLIRHATDAEIKAGKRL